MAHVCILLKIEFSKKAVYTGCSRAFFLIQERRSSHWVTHRILRLPPSSRGERWGPASCEPSGRIPGGGLGPVWGVRSGAVCGVGLLHLIILNRESQSCGPHSAKNTTMFQSQCSWIVRHWKYGKACYFPPACHITTENKLDYFWRTFLKMVLFSTQTKGSIFFLSLGLFLVFFFVHFILINVLIWAGLKKRKKNII